MSGVRAVLVPGALALLPAYASEVDPVARLRAACLSAVAGLVAGEPRRVVVVARPLDPGEESRGVQEAPGHRLARHLLREAGYEGVVTHDGGPGAGEAILLVGNGSACRSEKAPGHLDERAFGLDDALDRAVREGTAPPHDEHLARELWCFDLPVFQRLHAVVTGPPEVRYHDDPYGVASWVATWHSVREVEG